MPGGSRRGGDRQNELLLGGQASQWTTPKAWDGQKGGLGQNARELARNTPSLKCAAPVFPAQPTGADGEPSLQLDDSISRLLFQPKRRLNYRFVQALMGFPDGWL